MTPYDMHMLRAQTFGCDAASSSCVRVCQNEAPPWAVCLLFPVFFREVVSTCGPEGGREAGERMCVFV